MPDMSYFLQEGVYHFGRKVNDKAAHDLLQAVYDRRDFGPALFQEEKSFRDNPVFKGVNPEKGRNLAENLNDLTLFVDDDLNVREVLETVLGREYRIMDKKFVCGIPTEWMPNWVQDYIAETGVKNLGAFMKPENRDITYFSGIDFHQDIIDWPQMGPNFITMYVYLDDVQLKDAPLHLLPGSHRFGASTFPHKLDFLGGQEWSYEDDQGRKDVFECKVLTGKAGDVSLWHPFILHGTQPDISSSPRISLRYLIQADPRAEDCALRRLNALIDGPMELGTTRKDLNESGEAVIKGNYVNRIKY